MSLQIYIIVIHSQILYAYAMLSVQMMITGCLVYNNTTVNMNCMCGKILYILYVASKRLLQVLCELGHCDRSVTAR